MTLQHEWYKEMEDEILGPYSPQSHWERVGELAEEYSIPRDIIQLRIDIAEMLADKKKIKNVQFENIPVYKCTEILRDKGFNHEFNLDSDGSFTSIIYEHPQLGKYIVLVDVEGGYTKGWGTIYFEGDPVKDETFG